MTLGLAIYLASIADNLRLYCGVGCILLFICIVISCLVALAMSDEHQEEAAARLLKRFTLPITFLLVFILTPAYVLTPSSRAVAAMYVIPKLLESPLATKGYQGLEVLMDEWIEELRPNRKEQPTEKK